jgi:ribosomal-protein-alanine N-acetyltransferase
MKFTVGPLTTSHAEEIAAWHYEPPYDFYDMEADPEDLEELLDPGRRDRFRAAIDETGALVGFYYFLKRDDEVEIGLGLRPDLTGLKHGRAFLETGLEYARHAWTPVRFRLFVAAFNKRAIRLYEKASFRRVGTATRTLALGDFEFLELEREAG